LDPCGQRGIRIPACCILFASCDLSACIECLYGGPAGIREPGLERISFQGITTITASILMMGAIVNDV
jgi:hypothetical protein